MQPFHFESFIVNYVVLVGAVILAGLLWQNMPRKTLLWIASLCILLGVVEVELQAGAFSRTDTTKDEMIPVLKRLDQLPAQNGSDDLFPASRVEPDTSQRGRGMALFSR